MTTKYDIDQTVFIKAKILGISVGNKNDVSYHVILSGSDGFDVLRCWIEEEQIYGCAEPSDKVSTDEV